MRYDWFGAMFKDIDPQVAGEHIESLVEKYKGHLTADEVLADARNARSPLHSAFEWDENAAAEKWRRKQAKTLVNTLVIKQKGKNTDRETKRKSTRAFVFVHVEKHGKNVYVPLRSAVAQPELKAQLIEKAYRELESWARRWGGHSALKSMTRDVERIRRRIEVEYLTAAGVL